MSRLYYHEKSDRRKWAAITIVVLLIIAAIVLGVLTNWYTAWNKYCVFGHDYGEDNKCVRCGKDKPIENEPEVGPQAFISEPYRMSTASARRLNANSRAAVSGLPGGITLNMLGEVPSSNCETVTEEDYGYMTNDTYIGDYSPYILINNEQHFTSPTTIEKKSLSFSAEQNVYLSFYCLSNTLHHGSGELSFLLIKNLSTGVSIKVNLDVTGTETNLTGYYYKLPFGHYEVRLLKETYYGDDFEQELDYYSYSCTLDIIYGVSELPSNPSKTGYTFTGWYTDEACTKKYTASTVTADITLYAGFRAHTYSIKFNANSGAGTMSNEPMTYDQAKALTAIGFTKDHYAFKGWATTANGAVAYTDKQSVKNLTATDGAVIELFAVWERSEVKVDFVSEGKTTTTWIAIGTKATLPSNPTKDGHTFVGWYMADGTKYETQNISEDTTLTARFEIIRCTVTFIVDGEVYATYVCDWGTSLADALNANDINPALLETEDEYSRNF